MLTKYRTYLKVGSASPVLVRPRWADDAAFVTTEERGEMYFRETLNITFQFQRADYDLIEAAALDTLFLVTMEKQQPDLSWSQRWEGRFWKTDVGFDPDTKTATVSPETNDSYEALLGGMEKEFNLIALEPPTVTVQYLKQAVLQVALPGADFVANFTDGMFWETPCDPLSAPTLADDEINHNKMLDDYGFGVNKPGGTFDWAYLIVAGVGDGLDIDVAGIYRAVSYSTEGNPGIFYRRADDAYELARVAVSGGFRIVIRHFGGVDIYASDVSATGDLLQYPYHASQTPLLTSLTSPSSVCHFSIYKPYVRLLTNLEDVNGDATTELPTDDPFPHGSFTRSLPIQTGNFVISDGHSTTATRWGKFDEAALHFPNEYFTKPTNAATLMPVCPATWKNSSFWFYLDALLRDTQQEGSETALIKNAYRVSDVITAFLGQVAPGVSHPATVEASDFFYSDGLNPVRGSKKVPIIIPKSNVLVGDYEEPAKKAPLRFVDLVQLLRFFHNCFWHIDEDNVFRVEHRRWYENGGVYTGQNIGSDLTTLLEPRTGKPWSYRSNGFKYAKEDMPERIEFRWMDRVSQPFEGYPIQVQNGYVKAGNIRANTIGLFTSDIDYLHVSPSDVSKEGFVFLECVEQEATFGVPFVPFTVGPDEVYTMQNGHASMIWGHDKYHRDGLPAENVTLNTNAITATSTARKRQQDIELTTGTEMSPYQLIETDLGAGRISSMEESLQNGSFKLTINHDNE